MCRRCWEWYLVGIHIGGPWREPGFFCPRCDGSVADVGEPDLEDDEEDT
jgi:hypothetical protein